MNHPFRRTSLLGVDVQASSVRIIQLSRQKRGFLIEQCGIRTLPSGVMHEAKIKDWEMLRIVLDELVENLNLKGKVAAICLPSALVQIHHMAVPVGIRDTAIEMEVRQQMERDFPGMSDTLCMDFDVNKQEENGDWKVTYVVAHNEYVSDYIQCINSVGLNLKIIEVDIFALKRFLESTLTLQNQTHKVNAFIINTNETPMILAMRGNEIIYYEQWDKLDIELQLNNKLQMILPSLVNQEKKQVNIYSQQQYHREWMKTHESMNEVYEFNPWSSLNRNAVLHADIDEINCSDFLVASGLAMREVPKW